MKIQLIDPDPGSDGSPERHARMVPILGTVGLPTLVLAGAEIEVPDEIAGAGPHWRAPKDGEFDGDQGIQHLAYLRDTGQLRYHDDGAIKSVHDLGHGLLAQVDVWSRVDAPAPKSSGGLTKPEGGGK